MFNNLDAEQKRRRKTNAEMAQFLGMSRNSYESKKKTGRFTYKEIRDLLLFFDEK